MIKVCSDDCCSAVYHNIPKKKKRCDNCDSRLVLINEKTYIKKYINEFFQYDFRTGELVTVKEMKSKFLILNM